MDDALRRNTELITPDQYAFHLYSVPVHPKISANNIHNRRSATAIAFGYPRVRSCEYRRVNDLWLSATCAVVNGGRWLRSEKRSATTFVPFRPGRKSEFSGIAILSAGGSCLARPFVDCFQRHTSCAKPKIFYILRLIIVIYAGGVKTSKVVQKLPRKALFFTKALFYTLLKRV